MRRTRCSILYLSQEVLAPCAISCSLGDEDVQRQTEGIFREMWAWLHYGAEAWDSVCGSGLLSLRGRNVVDYVLCRRAHPYRGSFAPYSLCITYTMLGHLLSAVTLWRVTPSCLPVKPQPPFNLTAVLSEGYNISWETIYQNSPFYFLNEELEYQLRYKRRTDTWEVSEMSVYHQLACTSKEEASMTRTGVMVWKEGFHGLEKVSLCLSGLKRGRTEKRIEKQKLFEKY